MLHLRYPRYAPDVIEKLTEDGYKNEIKRNHMLQYQLKYENYWIKDLVIVYLYGLNDNTKFMNKCILIGRLFPLLARYGEHYIKNTTL